VIGAVVLWLRMLTMYVSVRDGHLRWRVLERWATADEKIAAIARIVLASNGDLKIEFLGGHAPLQLKSRREYRAEDLRALARLLATESEHSVIELDALPAVPE